MAIKPATTPGRPMSETAYRTLRERVLTCKLTPGARLTERGTAAARSHHAHECDPVTVTPGHAVMIIFRNR